MLFYDYLLTFPAEVHYFWRRPRFNLSTVLFIANRYFALCIHILITTQMFFKSRPGDDLVRWITILSCFIHRDLHLDVSYFIV